MIFVRKKKEPYPEEEVPKLPTIEEILKEQQVPTKDVSEPAETPKKEIKQEIKKLEKVEPKSEQKKPVISPKVEERKVEEKIAFAPLFVKLERYRQILNLLIQVKSSFCVLKSHLSLLKELEKLRDENIRLLQETINRIEQKVLDLDSELLLPAGLKEEFFPQTEELSSVESIINDLKTQINELRKSLEATK
jgi:cob(I)alamin adenosyltransferase